MKPYTTVHAQAGFTLIEVMVSLFILAALAALTFINLGHPQTTASVNSTAAMLVADLATERSLAMAGDGGSTNAQQPHGIHFSSDDYTLFTGAAFQPNDSGNYTASLDDNVQLSTTLPGGEISFDSASGEVHDYDPARNSVTLSNDGYTKTITVNRLGTVTVN